MVSPLNDILDNAGGALDVEEVTARSIRGLPKTQLEQTEKHQARYAGSGCASQGHALTQVTTRPLALLALVASLCGYGGGDADQGDDGAGTGTKDADGRSRLREMMSELDSAALERDGAIKEGEALSRENKDHQERIERFEAMQSFNRIGTDIVSETDLRRRILALVEAFRWPILQWSTSLWKTTSSVGHDRPPAAAPVSLFEAGLVMDIATRFFPPIQTALLDEALVQVALGFFCSRIWQPFFPGCDYTVDQRMKEILINLRATKEPPHSSKWRELTFAAIAATGTAGICPPSSLSPHVAPSPELVRATSRELGDRIESVAKIIMTTFGLSSSALPGAVEVLLGSLEGVIEQALTLKFDAMLRSPLVESSVVFPSITATPVLQATSIILVQKFEVTTWTVGRNPTVVPATYWTVEDFWDI